MKKIFLFLIGVLISVNSAFATHLPIEVQEYIKKTFPSATIRFDGLVTLPDGTMYLPLFPSLSPKGQDFGIKYSVPKKSQLANKPDLLIFNNNFALIKMIKQKEGGYKVYFQEGYPTEVMTSILPQDLLVPRGLVLPDSLESILGDLVIPTTSAISYAKVPAKAVATGKKNVLSIVKKEETVVQKSDVLKNKIFFIANSDSRTIKIVHSDKVEPSFTLKLSNVPQDIVASSDNQYLFVISHGQTTIDVIDIKREEIVKQIDCEVQPTQLILSDDGQNLYAASQKGSAIFVVDIKDMTLSKKINVMGAPHYVTFNDNYSKLYYYDKLSSNIYSLDITGKTFLNEDVMSCPNVSSIAVKGNDMFVLSRTRNKLITYSLEINEVISELDLPEKPVDMLLYNDELDILCAKDNKIVIVDTKSGEILKISDLLTNGFARKLNRVQKSDIVLISDAREGFYNVYSLTEQKVIQKNKLSIPVTVMTIVDNAGIDRL